MTAAPRPDDRAAVRARVQAAKSIAVLTGAGMSAESGVPTFRDALTGLWAHFRPEELATEDAFRARPPQVWDWYATRRAAMTGVRPNAGHQALAAFQARHPGRLTLITQNVDGLHQAAGSAPVLALHGSLAEDRWLDRPQACCQASAATGNLTDTRPPACPVCGNLRRPAVVWFGENLPELALRSAEAAAQACDLILVVGTSGAVYPAAGLAFTAHQAGARVVVVNPEPSELDRVADVVLRGTAATLLPALLAP
jgi:NAD-dependent deacetylase